MHIIQDAEAFFAKLETWVKAEAAHAVAKFKYENNHNDMPHSSFTASQEAATIAASDVKASLTSNAADAPSSATTDTSSTESTPSTSSTVPVKNTTP